MNWVLAPWPSRNSRLETTRCGQIYSARPVPFRRGPSAALHKPGPPSWTGNSLGQADKVLAPWEPLSGDAAQGEVHCWGRAYKFGTLLQEVRSNDVGLLSQPVQIEAVVAGTAHEFSGPPCQVQAASDTRSQWTK